MEGFASKVIVPLVAAVIPLGIAYVESQGKAEAENNNKTLIQQQNEIIKRYEEDAKRHEEDTKRYVAIISFLDSSSRAKQSASDNR